MNVQARAPAKLIISGEHAVVYGQPAVAMAINRYASASITAEGDGQVLSFAFPNIDQIRTLTYEKLGILKKDIEKRYAKFLEDGCSIRQVIREPAELLLYGFYYFCQKLNLKTIGGLKITIFADFPVGSGMGSSAAMIISMFHAIANFFSFTLPRESYLLLGREVENKQHGHSSGLDVYLASCGGCVLFQNGTIVKRDMPKNHFLLALTGRPESTTGECVKSAARYLRDEALLKDFAAVTIAVDTALQGNDREDLKRAIRANHELLCRIGVVPEKVRAFISDLEKHDAAAKICGAGSVLGQNGGIVLIIGDRPHLNDVLQKYNYDLFEAAGIEHGVEVI